MSTSPERDVAAQAATAGERARKRARRVRVRVGAGLMLAAGLLTALVLPATASAPVPATAAATSALGVTVVPGMKESGAVLAQPSERAAVRLDTQVAALNPALGRPAAQSAPMPMSDAGFAQAAPAGAESEHSGWSWLVLLMMLIGIMTRRRHI